MFNFKFNFNFVPVSTDFIENYMSAAHGEYVKVYLYILSAAVRGSSAETRAIAKKLNMLESDVINAIEYWEEKGLLSSDGDTVCVGERQEVSDITPSKTPDPEYTKRTAASLSADPLTNAKLKEIAQMAQTFLGKALTNTDTSTLYWIYSELSFSAEVIMMLLEYCVSKGKTDMRYIEQVAIGWHRNGIADVDSVEKYLTKEKENKNRYNELKKLFGITDRSLSKTEESLLDQWSGEYKMSTEMIALAYEYCIMAIGKVSFQYMDSIIKNWHTSGISTVAAAEKDHAEFKNRTKRFTDKDTAVYKSDGTDYDEIERLMNEKY